MKVTANDVDLYRNETVDRIIVRAMMTDSDNVFLDKEYAKEVKELPSRGFDVSELYEVTEKGDKLFGYRVRWGN